MKKRFGYYLPLLFASLLFFLSAFTSWGQTVSNLHIDGRTPSGTYHRTVPVTFNVSTESDVAYYSVQYSLNDFTNYETILNEKILPVSGSYSISWPTNGTTTDNNLTFRTFKKPIFRIIIPFKALINQGLRFSSFFADFNFFRIISSESCERA